MKAQIKRTNSGRYYITVEAITTAEQLELTAMREQMRESGDVVHEFGGSMRHNDEVNRSLETELNFIVREPDNRPPAPPKPGLFARVVGRRLVY